MNESLSPAKSKQQIRHDAMTPLMMVDTSMTLVSSILPELLRVYKSSVNTEINAGILDVSYIEKVMKTFAVSQQELQKIRDAINALAQT